MVSIVNMSTFVQKSFAVGLVSLVVTGCTLRPKAETTTTTTTTTGTATTQPGTAPSLATPVNYAYPGPYKTFEKDGIEYRQGRFPQGKYGGVLVQPIIASDPKTFNYWAASDTGSTKMGSYMWAGLLGTDPYNGEIFPDLAAEYKVLPDHLTYEFRLRKGLKWSDGKPLTADDVVYTYETILGKRYGSGSASMHDVLAVGGKFPTVEKVDDLTVRFKTAEPFAPFLRQAGGVPIAPKHVMEPIISKKDGRKKFEELWSQTNMDPKSLVTCGPFRITGFVPSQRVEFERAPNYYVVDPAGKPLPYLDRLAFVFVPDVNLNKAKFLGQETDITQLRNRDSVDLQKQKVAKNFELYNLGQDTGSTFLMFNMNPRKNDKGNPFVAPYKSAWFNDVNFRQAVNHALNRQQMVDGYFKGIGFPLYTAESPSSITFNQALKPFEADTAYSMSLLEKSGFKKKPDGFLYDKDGKRVEFNMLAGAGGTFNETIGNYIVEDLKKLGMKVNFQQIETNSFFDKVDHSKDWEACIFALTGDPLEPNSGANVWRSNGRLHVFDQRDRDPKTGEITVSDARTWEQQIDGLFDKGVLEFDGGKRKNIYGEFQQIVYDQAPFIFLVSPMNIIGCRNTVKNFQPTNLSSQAWGLHNIDEVYKEKETTK